MAARRDDIVVTDRAQIAIEMMSPHRPLGRATQLAQAYNLSRQGVYDIAGKGLDILLQALHPGQHGPRPREQQVKVTKNHLRRSVLTSVSYTHLTLPTSDLV